LTDASIPFFLFLSRRAMPENDDME